MILWSAGSNAQGQLATGNDEDAHGFKRVIFEVSGKQQPAAPGTVLQIACGANHTLALLRVHPDLPSYLWGAGDGSKGQLGLTYTHGSVFRPLSLGSALSDDEIVIIQAAWETSFVVARSEWTDRILSFGSQDFGLLGIGDKVLETPVSPVEFGHLFSDSVDSLRVSHLKAGPRHVLAVIGQETPEGRREMLIGWGAGRHGQLAVRDSTYSKAISSPAGPRRVALPVRITTWFHPITVKDVAVGNQHALILTSSGTILQLGSNAKSQLPNDSIPGHPLRVFSTWNNSFVAIGHGPSFSLLSYGRNEHGQLGRNQIEVTTAALTPQFDVEDMACGSEHCLIVGKRDSK
jgi:protein ATS1